MRPEIEEYLREHGATYTTATLRRQLLRAGYQAGEIDAALEETGAARAPQLAETKALRSQFWGLAFLINLVVLVAVTGMVSGTSPYAGAVFIVLGIAMLIGLGVSGSIGGSLLPGRGLLVALAVPAVAALILGGACYAMMQPSSGSGEQSTRGPGTIEVRIDAPLAFSGTGAATCELFPDNFGVSSSALGSIGDMPVSASVSSTGSPLVQPSDGERNAVVSISLQDTTAGFAYAFGVESMEEGLPMQPADGAFGTISFRGLKQLPTGAGSLDGQESISGTITWTCDLSQTVSSSGP
ncbi:MAG: hypothetical protein WD402_10605 [Chloroflexota bacterium]